MALWRHHPIQKQLFADEVVENGTHETFEVTDKHIDAPFNQHNQAPLCMAPIWLRWRLGSVAPTPERWCKGGYRAPSLSSWHVTRRHQQTRRVYRLSSSKGPHNHLLAVVPHRCFVGQ